MQRAMALSRNYRPSTSRTGLPRAGDLMLDLTGFKNGDDDSFRAEILARKVLSEELDGNYDIGSLFVSMNRATCGSIAARRPKTPR